MDDNHKLTTIPSTDIYFQAQRLTQAMAIATHFFNAKCFGADVKNPEQAFVKIQAGCEMGMAPMEAMNSLYIVNGKVTMYGMAMTKRLRDNGWKITFEDKPDSTIATITKGEEHYEYEATVKEVESLNSKAIKFAKKDKLKWHAISRLVRFYVPEITGGTVSYIKEEIEHMDFAQPTVIEGTETREDEPMKASPVLIKKLKDKLEGETDEEKLESLNKFTDPPFSDFESIAVPDITQILFKLSNNN